MDWPAIYNQYLVKRGKVLLCFDFIDNWDTELKEMNKDKIGEPFHYPNTFFLLLGHAKAYFHLPFRKPKAFYKVMLKEKYFYSRVQYNKLKNKQIKHQNKR